MKYFWLAFMAMFLLSPAASFSQNGNTTNGDKKLSVPKITGLSGADLTEEQIASMKTEWTDEKSNVKVHFSARFGAATVPAELKKKYSKSGKIPIRITCDLVESREVAGKPVAKRLGGSAHLYIKDSDGKVVLKKTVPLEKMCPS